MKVTYNNDENTRTCTCQVCGYKHTQETRAWGKTIDGDDEFIKINLGFQADGYGYSVVGRNNDIYACPKCGVLQLWT